MKFNRKYFLFFFALLNYTALADNSKTYIYCVYNSSFTNYAQLINKGIFNDSEPSRNTALYDSRFTGSSTNYSIFYITPNFGELNFFNLLESQGYIMKLKVGEAGVWTTINNPPSQYQTVWDIQRASSIFSVQLST